MTDYRSSGKTTLTPDVLLTIARMAALEVKGVKRMAPVKGGVNSLFRRGNDGIRIVVEDSNALWTFTWYWIATSTSVKSAAPYSRRWHAPSAEMTGMEVGHVNIHIEDIDYKTEA